MVLQMDSIKKANKSIWIQALAQDECFRADSVLRLDSIWPTPIAKCYSDLLYLMREGNVYGSLLQIRDLYETILKIPVLATLIYICGTSKDSLLNDSDLLEKWISKALSLGNWDSLASAIINKNKTGQYSLPVNLIDCIKKTRKLISKKIPPQYPNVLNWRNDVIGHGALQFEDSDEYQDAIRGMLSNLKNYFEGQGKDFRGCDRLYEKIVFTSDDITLRGKDAMLTPDNENLNLVVGGRTVDVGAFAKMSSFLFSSFYYNKRTIKYLDYKSGKDLVKDDSELREYVLAYQNTDKYNNNKVSAEIIRREEDELFSFLSQPGKYIPPENVFREINLFIDEHACGTIMLCMERGTGKSAFTNSIDTLYHDPDTAIIEDAVIRSYALGSADLRGVNDFINVINVVFTRSYDPSNDFRLSKQITPEIKVDDEEPAAMLANVLNKYQEIYADEFGIYNLVFVLDGVDEATIDTARILEYLPSTDLLNEGVYIICTSRFKEEDTVPDFAKKQIQNILDKSDLCIEVSRFGDENREMLEKYIRLEVPDIESKSVINLIEKSEYRMLYLKVHLAMLRSNMSDESISNIASEYMRQLQEKYNERSSDLLRKTAAMICLLGPITIKDYYDYLAGDSPTYEFIGILNDLLPLMTVRGSAYGREYMLANETYSTAISTDFQVELISLIEDIKSGFSKAFFPKENEPNPDDSLDIPLEEKIHDPENFARLYRERLFKKSTFWILTIKKALWFALENGFEKTLLTEEFVNNYLAFADMFKVNSGIGGDFGYLKIMTQEALQTALNMLIVLADKKYFTFNFSLPMLFGNFPRRLYDVEGYDVLLNKVFNKNTDKESLLIWKNVFFAQDIVSFDMPVHIYDEDKKLIDHINKMDLLEPVIEILSPSGENGYLPYLLYIQSLELSDDLMEKTMNHIVWAYLYDDFHCDTKEAHIWLKRIKDDGYSVLYPDNEDLKEKILSCLDIKEDLSEEIENLFWGFRLINADLIGTDYKKIDEVLYSDNPEIKTIARNELKKCLDVVDNILEAGIFPDCIWTDEDRSKYFNKMENGTLDDTDSEEWAAQDQYSILDNSVLLLKYTDLIYTDETDKVLEKWVACLSTCLDKHDDWDSYYKLHDFIDGLYEAIINHGDENNRIAYLSEYVRKYNTKAFLIRHALTYGGRNFLVNQWENSQEELLDDIILPSRASTLLMDMYYDAGAVEEARNICNNIAAGVTDFNKNVIDTINESNLPISIGYYLSLHDYIQKSRQYGFSDIVQSVRIDFKSELSAMSRIVQNCNKYTDLTRLDLIINAILTFYEEAGAQNSTDPAVLSEMISILDKKTAEADEETGNAMNGFAEKIRGVQKEIYG